MRVCVNDNPIRSATGPLAALLLLPILSSCSEPATAPEQQLRAWVSQGQSAAESKQRRELVEMISPAYSDVRGRDRGDLENLLRAYFLRQNKIVLVTSIDEIRVFDDSAAEIELTVGLAGTNDGVLGFSADAQRFLFELQRDKDVWELISARWGQLGDELR